MFRAGVGLHVEASSIYAPIALKLGIKSKPQKKVKKISITFYSHNDSNEDTVKQENMQVQRTVNEESSSCEITRNSRYS
jgi:hypothetical protein